MDIRTSRLGGPEQMRKRRAGIQGLLPSADDSKVGPIGHTGQAAWSPWTLETGLPVLEPGVFGC